MRKDIQAKHIRDMALLSVVSDLMIAAVRKFGPSADEFLWTFTWDIEKRFPDVPRKVLAAKLAALVKRKLLDGCTCGCRGDFVITPIGRAFMAECSRVPVVSSNDETPSAAAPAVPDLRA